MRLAGRQRAGTAQRRAGQRPVRRVEAGAAVQRLSRRSERPPYQPGDRSGRTRLRANGITFSPDYKKLYRRARRCRVGRHHPAIRWRMSPRSPTSCRRNPLRPGRHPHRRVRQSLVQQQRREQRRLQRRHGALARRETDRRIRLPEVCANVTLAGPSAIVFSWRRQSLYAVYVNTQGSAPGYAGAVRGPHCLVNKDGPGPRGRHETSRPIQSLRGDWHLSERALGFSQSLHRRKGPLSTGRRRGFYRVVSRSGWTNDCRARWRVTVPAVTLRLPPRAGIAGGSSAGDAGVRAFASVRQPVRPGASDAAACPVAADTGLHIHLPL